MKTKHNEFVVFLDVDGVLNSIKSTAERTPKSNAIGIDYARVAILAKAMRKYGLGEIRGDIVLTSDWKDLPPKDEDYLYLVSKLADYGLEISGHIEGIKSERGKEVKAYLEKHQEIKEYIILDDNKFDFSRYIPLWERLLLTDGIENAEPASKTPAVEVILFLKDIKSSS